MSVVGSQFAADSSGFSTCRFDRWFDHKWGKEKSKRRWLKAHIVIGTQTNVITAVEISQSNVNDSPMLPWVVGYYGPTVHDGRGIRRQGVSFGDQSTAY